MTKQSIQKYWHEIFELTVFIKGINGVWEIVAGFFVLFLSKATINNWFSFIVYNELLEDPNDKFINFLTQALQNFSGNTKIFAAFYILFHGTLNIFLAIQLYRDKHWAYLVTIGTIIIFLFYQIYRISIYHSLILSIITIFDILFIVITWYEYKNHKEVVKTRV